MKTLLCTPGVFLKSRRRILVCFALITTSWPTLVSAQGWYWQNPSYGETEFFTVHFIDASFGWVAGDEGIVLHTTNGGTLWTPQVSGTTVELSSVRFVDAINGWMVGNGGTILHTSNAGIDWLPQPSGTTVWLTSVHFVDATTGWAVGDLGTILHTDNGGSTWTAQPTGIFELFSAVHFVDANTGWAVGSAGTILHSSDGGSNWNSQQSGTGLFLWSAYFTDSNNGWVVGSDGTILHTTNGGSTWAAQTSGITRNLLSIQFIDVATGWAVGAYGTILRTTNRGMTWEAQTSGTAAVLWSVSFVSDTAGWIAGGGGNIFLTTNQGSSWTSQTRRTDQTLWSIRSIDTSTGWVVGDLGTVLHTTDGGNVWTSQTSGTTQSLSSVFFVDENNGWTVGGGGTVLSTSNGGVTFIPQTSGTTDQLHSVHFIDLNNGWVVGVSGTILHTTNGGFEWILQSDNPIHSLLSVYFVSSSNGWAVGSDHSDYYPVGAIYRTTNGGNTWDVTTGYGESLWSVHFTDSLNGWAVGTFESSGRMFDPQQSPLPIDDDQRLSGGTGSILHTTNGGLSWTLQVDAGSLGLFSVYFVDPNIGWIVGLNSFITYNRILHTTNGGSNWIPQPGPSTDPTASVYFADANIGWTVGTDGVILHTTTGGTGMEPPAATTLSSPPNGSTVESNVTLSWNPIPEATWYAVQVSTSPYFITSVLNETNITEASHTVEGLRHDTTYYWRVSVTDNTGTSGWSESWSFTVANIPNQVVLASPDDGMIVTSDSVTLVWYQAFPEVDRYWLESDTDSLFSIPFTDSLLTDTLYTVSPLHHNATFWWRVRAHNSFGWGRFSEARDFFVFLEVPSPPLLLSPPDSATDVSTNPALSWSPSLGAESYTLQVSTTSDFSNLIVSEDSISNVSFDVSGLSNDVVYYWRVNASNELGTSGWSEVWSFRTIVSKPAQVILVYPSDGTLITTDTLIFTWHQSQPEIDLYWFEYAKDSLFTGSALDSTITDTAAMVTQLQSNRTYWWRVRAHNAAGWGPFSEAWDFSVLITNVIEREEIPTEFSLNQNYPNPFNPTTTIQYGLPEKAYVRFEVFNLLGQSVAVLVDGEQGPGYHTVEFKPLGLASGIYFYRMQAYPLDRNLTGAQVRKFVETKKLLLLR